MLQPRLFSGCEMGKRNLKLGWSFVCFVLFASLVSCQDLTNDELIEATRIKREGVPENRDLTVLLVNDQKKNDYSKIGRYHSVKPLIGLLTSTARTFIQDGVTTEFATQILGTTLDNGRIYAQLLTKSSLVLYNKPSNVDDPVVVKPTRAHSAFDGQWNVKQDLGFIVPEKFVLKNTDYLAPSSKMDIIYASKPAQDNLKYWSSPTSPDNQENQIFDEPIGRRVQPVKEIPRYVQNEALNFLDGPTIDGEKKFEFVINPSILENVNTLYRQSKAYEKVSEPIKTEPIAKENKVDESNIVKVKPDYDLPTFTIKNEFSPIFYYIDNVESRQSPPQVAQETKLPKRLFGQKSEPRPKKTFTYEGFADFTTVVGDTVIVFTPNTDINRPQNPDEVNVFPSARPVNKLSNKITFLASDIPVATSTFKANEVNTATKVAAPSVGDVSSETPVYNNEELQKAHYDIDNRAPDTISVQDSNGFQLNLDVIQPSEAGITTTESTRLTGDLGVIPVQDFSSKATDPLSPIQPSATAIEESNESVVTESDLRQVLSNSEEESENTAAEVTERPEEEEQEEIATETPEEILTTTESGHSEESSEEIETTTEIKHEIHEEEEEEELCTSGLETQSTMTTAYKTLTYLTTYFIPLESTETTTSVKSDVIVESDVGYLTNVVCRTNYDIEPTSVISVSVVSSVDSNLEVPETVSEESSSTPSSEADVDTEQPSKTTPAVEQQINTQEEKNESAETDADSSEAFDEDNRKETTTSTSTTTTTERVSTSQSHVEVSVSTEHSTQPTEKPSSEEEDETQENEIDLIYKTLYTTYTYFTTFFGDQTSSVESHKSVVTNIITSTIDLSKLDPSLLGAFNEDEIAPTSVGIGRPTESYHINSIIDLVKNKDVLESVEIADAYASQTPTPSLGDDAVASIKPDAVKTYYTTYTFFTTIYVGEDANVCSRSEVYTNYVGPDELIPTKSNPLATESTRAPFNFANCKQVKKAPPANPEENSSVETSVSMEQNTEKLGEDSSKDTTPQPTPITEVDMLFSVESNPLESDNSFVTDVKSSSSKGEAKYLDSNNILEDQISSESNIEEILPSPTLLLQTSYTTFTYFTTMYIGKDSSNVKSRLETITNVVTETIMPKKEQPPEEESNLPITYYTTFTYWTTLYKDKSTTITSREEIVSNVVTPPVQTLATISPIDTTPIDVESVLPPKDLEVELKPSVVDDSLEQDDGKATFYTTYTYFTTFYSGNTSNIKSSLETVTNIVDNTKVVEDNQLGRKVPSGAVDKNLIQDNGEKPQIAPTVVKEEIKTTALPDAASSVSTVLVGTYIDNLFAEVKPADSSSPTPTTEKKILFSQVAVISGDSTVVTSDNKTINNTETTTSSTTTTGTNTEAAIINATPEVIESSVAEPETTTEARQESEEDNSADGRKKSRLTFTPKKPTFTPVIVPFASRNRPTFSPKRVPLLTSATTITRLDFTPTITATPTLKSVRPTGFGGSRKQSAFPGSSSLGRRFSGRASASGLSSNLPSASRSGSFPRGSIQPTSRRTGFRSSSIRGNSLDYASRSALPKIRPTATSRLRNGRQSATISFPPEQNEAETLATQQEENATESLDEVTEAPVRTTNNPLLRFRRPPITRQPGTAITPRSTTPSARRGGGITSRGRVTTTTRRTTTTRSTPNPLLSLRRQRPNALFPRRNLFRQPEPEPEEEIKENEQKVEESEELLEEEEEFETDNDYDSSDRKEQQVATPSTPAPKKNNIVQIRPFAFRRRTKRQVDYGSRKYTNFRRPGTKAPSTRRTDPEPETEPPAPITPKPRASRYNSRVSNNARTTTASAPKSSSRQPFIIRGESRTTTTAPAYRRGKSRPSSSSRTTTHSSRPKAPRLTNSRSSDRTRTTSSRTTNKSRQRTTTSRASSRQRGSYENTSGERFLHNLALNDGKITITHHIPTEVTIPVVNGKITEYKSVLSATPSVEILLRNQVTASVGPLGNQQLVLAQESTELTDNGATKVIRYLIHETPTTTVVFTPTTIRGRRTSYSHILPSTVYNVEAVTQTIAPEINSNVPLANLLLSQLLLGNQQPAINPLLALQGQALLPQQAQTPVTEYKTRTTTYVTTVTDARETVLPITFRAFNTNGIVYDNSPWRPGRDMEMVDKPLSEEDDRKLKNLATRIMSNGVEVLVKDKSSDGKNDQTKYMEVKTIQPSTPSNMYLSNFPKIDKRIDSQEEDNFDMIQPSEIGHVPCTTSCSCSNTKTEGLKTKYTHIDASVSSKYALKTSKYGSKIDSRPTNKDSIDKKTQYGPYEFETSSHQAPTDRIVEKYTEVINDYSEEKEPGSVEESELLTNEQAPTPTKINKITNKIPEKNKPEKVPKPNKNKFVVADLLKLGSLGIKGLSQLAPVIEKMTGGFIKRQENKTTTTTTVKPVEKLTAYNVDKRIDAEIDFKKSSFPIYIPVDEMETSESQTIFTNATLHQNLAWAAEHKQPKAHIVLPKIVHESPLVNGGIPISPGEIITANSDVIVGKPAVGGPLTLAASGIKLHNPVNPPPIDSFVAGNEEYIVEEKPLGDQPILTTKVDDSYDLRPPELPRPKPKPLPRPNRPSNFTYYAHQNFGTNKVSHRKPTTIPISHSADSVVKTEHLRTPNVVLSNHGRPAFLDYIPSLAKPGNPSNNRPLKQHVDFLPLQEGNKDHEVLDNSASSSEIINTHVRTDGEYALTGNTEPSKPFLVDIQPSRVANVLIPHGSSTALVFAGSSEPHKTGDYVDDPLPYPEPGYFGSFSIDAPQMTHVHNVAPNNNKQQFAANTHINPPIDSYKPKYPLSLPHKDQPFRNDLKSKWKDLKRPADFSKIPPPTSNQETHVHFGPHITSYDPEVYKPNNGEFEKYNKVRGDKPKDAKEIIDKEYENYLAVPPPPPKMIYNQENQYDKSKPYSQKPIVHTKPVQDMKVFLNIQHPVPHPPPSQQQPPKVTSEIYFAAQAPNSKPTPTYTIHIPPGPPPYNSYLNKPTNTNIQINKPDLNAGQVYNGQVHNTFSVVSTPTTSNKSIATNSNNDKENTYTVTLNTATNVASGNVGEGQVIGSSVPVDVGLSNNNDALNTNIPIGSNFAITVDDGPSVFESYNLQEKQKPAIIYDERPHRPIEVTVSGDNRWNKSTVEKPDTKESKPQSTSNTHIDYYNKNYDRRPTHSELHPSIAPSINSHANFPMISEHSTTSNSYENVKPVTEYQEDIKTPEQRRPAKLIPNIPTNSHGWYSSVIMNENNLNNIKVDSTTRKVIPLTNDYDSDNIPEFGQKITSVGKPPTGYWTQNNPSGVVSNLNVGKPFAKPSTESSVYKVTPSPTKQYSSPNYIPHNFDHMRQPAYDIPIRDNSDETTTMKVKMTTEKLKPVYENSEEIYDGEEEAENAGEIDGEVSSESMKVPVVSASQEVDEGKKPTPSISLPQKEVFKVPSYPQKEKDRPVYDFNPGTQTEKPFRNKTNTGFQSNTIKPIYENDSNLKPRPFTTNAMTSLDHQLQQPHWQINQLMENATNISYEDNIDLNLGEEMNIPTSTSRPFTPKVPYRHTPPDIKYKKPPRPVFVGPNNSHTINDSNIITSTVHIKDKKPLIVEKPHDKVTLPTFTVPDTLELNRTSSEIIDLSPPPPTMDYSFRPSTNDEMIMGMSPPPPRTPLANRIPARIPSTPRPVLPIRTPPPYVNKPRRTLPPRLPTQKPVRKPSNRDEISTYRPAFDINNVRRPIYNDQPSSQLLPPPRDIPSRVVNSVSELPSPTISVPTVPNLVFPTPISSGWLTSSGIEFSSSFNFGPTSVQFPDTLSPSKVPESSEVDNVDDNSYSYEAEQSSSERDVYGSSERPYVSSERPYVTPEKPYVSSEKPVNEDRVSSSKEITPSTESTTPLQVSSTEENVSDSLPNESSQEESSTEKTRGPQGFKNRPRKPYPIRHDDKKSTSVKYKIPTKPTPVIRPTRTLNRPEILYPTRHTSIRKIVRPIPTRSTVVSTSIIESSESSIDDEFIRPTEVMKDDSIPTTSRIQINDLSDLSLQSQASIATPILNNVISSVRPTHHSGNEVKISDEVIPTKTEFKTTVITLTKTLSEPPKTVSSIGYVNLTHTLTVTHTKTSLVSLSEGAVTQTLVLTNTHTSTIVDVITEVKTQVQPTTIIETVTKHIPVPVEPTPVQEVTPNTKVPLDDISMSSEETENFIIKDQDTKPSVQKMETEADGDNDTFFVVMNKSQNGGPVPPVNGDIETGDYDGVTRNEQVNSNGVSQVLFGEILLAGTPFLETTNVNPGVTYGKECQPDCKASRNERCQRIDGLMKCVCRPGFARMFPDRPCKPTYTYSVKLALGSQGNERLHFHERLSDNASKEYHALAVATHEGINRMVMQSDLRDVFHGVHITGFSPVQMKDENGDDYQGVMNDFYVQLSDNAHESRLKEVIEKYLRNNNYSLGGTEVHAAGEFMDKLDVSDFDECTSGQFHDCSEHAQCFNLRGTYTCSCLEGFADLSVNSLYPGRICSAEPVGCERCNYHGACYSRDDRRVLCECFQWYAGSSCQINLKVVLISLVVAGAVLSVILAICAVVACSKRPRPEPRSIVACIQSMPSLHQGAMPSKQGADRRALISERGEAGDTASMQNASLPYMPAKARKPSSSKKCVMSDPPAHDPPPPPAPAVMIPRARLHAHHDSRENISRKRSLELSSEAKLISYLESGTVIPNDEMRRKHSVESSYSANKDRHNKQGALVSAGFKVSTTIRPDENAMKEQRDRDRDDLSSVNKADIEAELSRYDTMRKSYSQEDLSEWTDAERRIGELTLSEARSVGGTLPASTGRAASSTRLTHQEANTMAERDLGSTFLLPHVHLYKPDLTSDVSEFDSL